MQGILYEETSILTFLFVTVLLGGGGAWMTGRACARTWRPLVTLVAYILILGLAVRFIHYSIFGGSLLSAQYYIVDTIVLMIVGFVAFYYIRASQMVTQYFWLYESAGFLRWRPKG